ncbi:MAG: nucleoid-structuring protein H-NS [Chitinophagales bacterium]|nr:MAG: nucleoid-structuring protein H-NS [Chitinophagales bacterium]
MENLKEILEVIAEKNGAAIREAVDNLSKGLVKKDEFAGLLKEAGIDKETINNLTEAVEKQGLKLKEITSRVNSTESLGNLIQKHAEDFKKVSREGRGSVRMAFKANATNASIANSALGFRLPDIGQLPTIPSRIMPLFTRGQVGENNNGVIRYIDQATATRNAAPTAEAGAKPEAAVTWEDRVAKIETIANWLPVSRQLLDDVVLMQSEIENFLRTNVSLAVDQQLLVGNGTSPNLRGVYTAAPALVTSGYATIAGANLYDLLAVAYTDITQNTGYQPNVVVMNPVDVLRYKVAKGSDNHYVVPPFVTQNGQVISGMTVIESGHIAANTLVLGDFRFGTLYDTGDVTVEIGWINDQFVRNMLTMLAEIRLCLLIRDVNLPAFRKVTDISAAITDLATP